MTHGPKTILYVDHTAKLGGGEIALLNLVRAVDLTRFTPVVLLADDGPLVGRLRDAGVETHVLPLDAAILETRKDSLGVGSLLRLRRAGACVSYAARVAWFARARGADLIHTNSLKSDLYGGLAGRLARIPVLWHVRDHIDGQYLPRSVAIVFRQLARTVPRAVVANSESTLRRLTAAPSPNMGVAYSGVAQSRAQFVHDGCDVGEMSPASSPGSGPVVTLVGRIAPWKGQHVFVAAAALVLARFPGARFLVVGSPLFGEHEYEAAVRRQAAELGVSGRVEFLGFREDVAGLLAGTDVVVHASTLGEPFGQVVIEGMAAGKPVVATDGGALPEIVEDGVSGLLVPMGDAGAMAGAVMRLLGDPAGARAMGMAARERVRERFTIQHTAEKVTAVYDWMLGAERRQAVEVRRSALSERSEDRTRTPETPLFRNQ